MFKLRDLKGLATLTRCSSYASAIYSRFGVTQYIYIQDIWLAMQNKNKYDVHSPHTHFEIHTLLVRRVAPYNHDIMQTNKYILTHKS